MRVLVLLGTGVDVRVAPQREPRSGRVREEWLVREVDPASARALDLALELKTAGSVVRDHAGVEVTVIHLGPEAHELRLQQALARGCDRAIRVWDEEAAELHAAGAAVVLAAAAQAAGFDVVLVGTAGVVDCGGQLGQLLAARLGVPCVTQALEIHGRGQGVAVEVTRALDGGYRERVRAALPLVVTVTPPVSGSGDATVIPVRALLAAQQCDLPVWDLADLGVPLEEVRRAEATLAYGQPRPRHPRLKPIAAPDPTLPAFDRILKLIEGTVKRREGRVVRDSPEVVAEQIFATLRDEGWLDHLRLTETFGGSANAPGPTAES
jgi:electron transfer flavoprotein beta subunit